MLRTDGDPELRVFDPVIRSLHWLTLFLMVATFALAFSIDFLSSNGEAVALTQLHRSFGLTVWVVTLGRLIWRQFARFPNWPDDMPQAMRFAAQWSEYALYALLVTQPILGLLQTNAHGNRVNLFFLGQLPAVIGMNRPLAKQLLEVHETVGFLLLGLIALHASAALYHHFWRRDHTLDAMLPQGMRRRRPASSWMRDDPDRRRAGITVILLLAVLFGSARGARSEERIALSGQSGIVVPIIYDAVPGPKASVILFVGGDGDLAHQTGSFLLRVRARFVAAGMSVAVPDTPSDHPGGFGPLFRTWSMHIEDVAVVVAFLKRKAPVPVWAVGTSNGTISAATGAAYLGPRAISGIVLTSSVWLGGLGLVPVEKIAVPVLIVHDRNDGCPASQFALEGKNLPRLAAAPVGQLIAVIGGSGDGPRCGTGSPHDFYGIDNEVVPPIIDWIMTH